MKPRTSQRESNRDHRKCVVKLIKAYLSIKRADKILQRDTTVFNIIKMWRILIFFFLSVLTTVVISHTGKTQHVRHH